MKRFIVMAALILAVIGTSCLTGQTKGNSGDGLEWRRVSWVIDRDVGGSVRVVATSLMTHIHAGYYTVKIGYLPNDTDTRNEILAKEETIAGFLVRYLGLEESETAVSEGRKEKLEQELLEAINSHILTGGKARAVLLETTYPW